MNYLRKNSSQSIDDVDGISDDRNMTLFKLAARSRLEGDVRSNPNSVSFSCRSRQVETILFR